MEVKRTQVRFTRTQVSPTKFKTRVKLERTANYTPVYRRGAVHKIVGVKDRFVGDVPSLKNKLHSINPKTFKGKTALFIVKSGEAIVRKSMKLTAKTAMAAENILFVTKDAVLRRNRVQLHFTRTQGKDGKFKTKARIDFAKTPRARQRGVIHKIVGLKRCFVGDVPSLKSKLHSIKPKRFIGKTALFTAKTGEAFTRHSISLGVNTALHSENAALKGFDYVKRPLYLQAERQYYKFKYSDETLRGILTAGGILKDVAKLAYKPQKDYKKYLHAKDNLLQTKQTFKFTKKSNKKALKKKKKVFKKQKKSYKWHKKSYSRSSKTPIQNLLFERRQQIYKDQKKDYKKLKHNKKKANKLWRKQLYKQKKVVKKQKKLITEPFKEVLVKKPLLSAWYKVSAADETNDFMSAADKALTVYRQIRKTPQTKLHKAQRKADKLHSKASKAQGKLKGRESLLHNRKYKKKYNKKKVFNNKHRFLNNTLSQAINGIKILRSSAGKLLLFLAPIVLFLIIIFVLTFQSCAAIFSNSGFILGTYNAEDKDIAKSEEYYTQLAWDYNEKVIAVGKNDTWRYALRAFGISDSDYIEEPEEIIFGTSSRFPDGSNYDYDPYTLISFLCAYNYDFAASREAEANNEEFDIEYWEFNNKTKNILERLFDMQYQFDHYYDNTSHWEELYNYNFLGGGGSDYSYYTVYADESYHDKVKARSIPNEIWQYTDSDGFIHFNSDLEVLDAKHDNERTGWFIQDQRYIIIDPSGYQHYPFFNYNNNKFCWIYNGHEKVRGYWGWSESDQAWWLVPPSDTKLWNSALTNTCLISFYRKNEWVEDCRLYYTVHQKMTLDEACQSILSDMDYKDERLQYYNLLKNGDESMEPLHGGHQSLASPLSGNFNDMMNKVYNGYGWDMQQWNQLHCSSQKHQGVDYICAPGSSVYSMIDGEIVKIDPDKHMVQIKTTSDMSLWDKSHEIRITYYNVNIQNFDEGDTVTAGTKIGYSTGHRICNDDENENAQEDYIHITTEFYHWGWNYIDSRFLINF